MFNFDEWKNINPYMPDGLEKHEEEIVKKLYASIWFKDKVCFQNRDRKSCLKETYIGLLMSSNKQHKSLWIQTVEDFVLYLDIAECDELLRHFQY
ncbi:hypothetical protein ACFL03_06510 [Thermodesulfobacteriota bacterium]